MNLLELADRPPRPMILFCPDCGEQHIDKPEPENGWHNPPHKTHLCHGCGNLWRPSAEPTVGVAAITEQPLSKKWRRDMETANVWGPDDKNQDNNFQSGYMFAKRECIDNLESYHDEGRGLLRRMVEAVDNFNNTRPEKMVDHVWALGSLLKVTNEASKHLRGDSDEA